jgi:hypothetical protein
MRHPSYGERVVNAIMRPPAVALGLVLLAASPATAQVESGPKPGEKPEPFKAYVTTGENPDRVAEPVDERKDKPTVFLFVQGGLWTRPVARFVKNLDNELEKGVDGAEGASAVAVWLTEEPEAAKAYQPRAQMSLTLTKTVLAVFEGPKTGPKGWSLYDAVPLTAVVVRGGKVVKSVTYDPMNEPDPKEVVDALRGK